MLVHGIIKKVSDDSFILFYFFQQTLPGMSPMCGAYLNFSVSFHHKYLAVFTDSGYIWMGMSSLKVRTVFGKKL